MTRKDQANRNGSAPSEEPVKQHRGSIFSRSKRAPVAVKPDKKQQPLQQQQFDRDAQISPSSNSHFGASNPLTSGGFASNRQNFVGLEPSGGVLPSPHGTPSTAHSQIAPWDMPSSFGQSTMPSSAFPDSVYDDSKEEFPMLSPGFGPPSGVSDSPDAYFPDQRRPSQASIATASSQGSKKSAKPGGFHKKLTGFFGEDVDENEEDPNPQNNGRQLSEATIRDRNDSLSAVLSNDGINDSKPNPSQPSSDIAGFLYQDPQDIAPFGEPPSQDKTSAAPGAGASYRPSFLAHRNSKGKEDFPKSLPKQVNNAARPAPIRQDSRTRMGSTMPPIAIASPSNNGGILKDPGVNQKSPPTTKKTTLFGRLSKKATFKDDSETTSLKTLPGSSSSLQSPNWAKPPPTSAPRGSIAPWDTTELGPMDATPQKKGLMNRVPFVKTTRGQSYEGSAAKDVKSVRKDSAPPVQPGMLGISLTDLDDMEGILSQPTDGVAAETGIMASLKAMDEKAKEDPSATGAQPQGAWDAPDSWAVKKDDDPNADTQGQVEDEGVIPDDADDGINYCVRVFRVDSTFAVLSIPINSTASEVLSMLGKKSFLQDNLENYQIVMRKQDLQRVLGNNERPVAIQKRLLEQAGYMEADHLDEVGREDNSYLCRFTFLPAKLTGYYSLEKDHGLNKLQKFSHLDLSGRNLVTIPLPLYQKSADIHSLNLSRNLALDVPKDFIQSCINLREIKFTSNEAWKLPQSFGLASRLSYLDISNNRLEHLEPANLQKLDGLLSLKMANNKISKLPQSFSQFQSLRSLTMSSNMLEEFPEFLCDLTTLVEIDISFNFIQEFPESFGKLKNLERLWATNNKFTGTYTKNFADLENLREIDMRYNGITNIDVLTALPQLEQLMIGHNQLSVFEGTFAKMRVFNLNSNPVTRFEITSTIATLTSLSISSGKLSSFPNMLFERTPNLERLVLDKNHFAAIDAHIGKLRRLQHLSLAKNCLNSLPAEIGCLVELQLLDVRENNMAKLPAEIWCCSKLETLNVSSNVLDSFPKAGASPPAMALESLTNGAQLTPSLSSDPSMEDLSTIDEHGRRPSQTSLSMLSQDASPIASPRKPSISSAYTPSTRKPSMASRTTSQSTMTAVPNRKDSTLTGRVSTSFAGSLRNLYLADNRLTDEVFEELTTLPELRLLNVSYNDIYSIPQRSFRKWPMLSEFYASGNELSTLPGDDFEEASLLRVLHINGNKFQTLPAELGNIRNLAVLDCGSNSLKYNVSNWPYDWNWNYNENLKYLNLSDNKRLEIKPTPTNAQSREREQRDLTAFTDLRHLRVLGLIDVTLTSPTVPEQTEDRRVRTSGSVIGPMSYGMADTLGRQEHLSIIDMVVPRFRGHEGESLAGMFDGQSLKGSGSKVAKYLHENFGRAFATELDNLKAGVETPTDALRRTFLTLNKDLATAADQALEKRPLNAHRGSTVTAMLSTEDLNSGGIATVMYLQGMELYVANIGNIQAMLIQSDGNHKILTRKHDPAELPERKRIRMAGGYVSRNGKLNDELDVSRAFGYINMMPAVNAAPHTFNTTIRDQDEILLIASRELWEYLTPDFVVDVARSERGDMMMAAQKLRDLAMSFGATDKIMVMVIGVSALKKRERNRTRGASLSVGPSGIPDDHVLTTKRTKTRRAVDATLSRLDQEIDAPTGEIALVFTDIKNSTLLWETFPEGMRAAIKQHNGLLRRQLRIIGGYEVKTEGDAFMVSFPTATSALLWCFSVQSTLLEIEWPAEILNSVHGQEIQDSDGNIIFKGLWVRMGIHFGTPVCEPDPITKRMDYFGPMVNRAARISSVADGGQITVSSDCIAEIQRALETHADADTGRNGSIGSEDAFEMDPLGASIRRDLKSLLSQGFEVKDLGEKKLKGLENPEYVYLMYPHSLAGRLIAQPPQAPPAPVPTADDSAALNKDVQYTISPEAAWGLWAISLRLEMLCSTLEDPSRASLKPAEFGLLERMKSRPGEMTDLFLLNLVEHQLARIETCTTTLQLRNMARPFSQGMLSQSCPIAVIMTEITEQLAELQAFRCEAGPVYFADA